METFYRAPRKECQKKNIFSDTLLSQEEARKASKEKYINRGRGGMLNKMRQPRATLYLIWARLCLKNRGGGAETLLASRCYYHLAEHNAPPETPSIYCMCNGSFLLGSSPTLQQNGTTPSRSPFASKSNWPNTWLIVFRISLARETLTDIGKNHLKHFIALSFLLLCYFYLTICVDDNLKRRKSNVYLCNMT